MFALKLIKRIKRYKLSKSFKHFGNSIAIYGHPKFINPKHIAIGDNASINDGVIINATDSEIYIGDSVTISANAMIIAASYDVNRFLYDDTIEKRKHCYSKINISSNVWICAGAIILPNVFIADHVIIGAGSVVTHSISESYVIVAGNPARIIKHISINNNEGL